MSDFIPYGRQDISQADEEYYQEAISLPLYYGLTQEDRDKVVALLTERLT